MREGGGCVGLPRVARTPLKGPSWYRGFGGVDAQRYHQTKLVRQYIHTSKNSYLPRNQRLGALELYVALP